MKNLKIWFCDFWDGYNPKSNYFTNILNNYYNLIIDEHNPDILIYSVFGSSFKKYNCIKIFYSGENIAPNYNECNYSLCYDFINDERHFRLPLFLLYGGYYDLLNRVPIDNEFLNRNFCNFIVSNGSCKIRNDFFHKLNEYKKVDSGGRYLNNIGYNIDNKLEFQKKYKFSLCFENDLYRKNNKGIGGYTTEKILDAYKSYTIPIYWGNPKIHLDFNKESMISYYDFNNIDNMIDYIIKIDNNDQLYLDMLNKNPLPNSNIPNDLLEENIKNFLVDKINKHII